MRTLNNFQKTKKFVSNINMVIVSFVK